MRWEGRTMRSGTSFFNKTLIRTDIRRYWPVLFAYTAVWMSLPLTQWSEAQYIGNGSRDYFAGDTIYEMMPAAIAIALVFGCMMAMAVFSYLTNSRSVGLMHSLPVRRTTHFVSHVASALGMFVVANVFVALLTLLVQALTGSTAPMDVLVWLAVSTMLDIIFFSMAVVCCMFTGWLLAVPVLFGALNCFVWVVQMLLQSLGKRIRFLEEVCTALELTNPRCVHARAEEFARDHREAFDLATSRAVASLPTLCELTLPMVKVGGAFLAMKALDSDEEIHSAKSAIAQLGGHLEEVREYTIPGTDVRRRVVVIRKDKPTAHTFPRPFARIKKSPLR